FETRAEEAKKQHEIGIGHAGALLTNANERVAWLDYAKAIGIAAVCLFHTIGGFGVDQVGPRLHLFVCLLFLFIPFAMPLFFFLSGLAFSSRWPASVSKFTQSTVISILVPYLMWSVAYISIRGLFSESVNNPASYSEIYGILV